LTPVAWGDWRYALVPKVSGDDLVVVLREPTEGKTAEAARLELIDFIGLAAAHDARAVALDYYFTGESAIDSALCSVIDAAGLPVLVGYGFERFQRRIQPLPVPASLDACVTESNAAHLVGFLDADRKARLMPLFFGNDTGRPALSLMAARTFAGENDLPVPANGQLRFVEPVEPHVAVRLADLRTNPSARNALHDRLVMLGEESDRDAFDTPSGRKPGAVVHADATHSLLHSHYIQDVPWWVSLAFVLISCYLLAASCAAGVSATKLAMAAAVATLGFVAVAVAGILTGPYWFDVAYPTAAVWLLLPLLLGLRRVLTKRQTVASTE
jgi:CHASE2 domain-containing sensor protein